jgi:hypothetical protein
VSVYVCMHVRVSSVQMRHVVNPPPRGSLSNLVINLQIKKNWLYGKLHVGNKEMSS